jgi:hypothetical protein
MNRRVSCAILEVDGPLGLRGYARTGDDVCFIAFANWWR